MSQKLITSSILTNIANAIRTLKNKNTTIKPKDFANEISEVQSLERFLKKEYTIITAKSIEALPAHVFQSRTELRTVNLPNCTHFNSRCFSDSGLTTFNAPQARNLADYCFSGCNSLVTISFPTEMTISNNVFDSCTNLRFVKFLNGVNSITSGCFKNCSKLEALVINKNAVITLVSTNALQNTKIASGTGYIYVPRAKIEDYKTSTNWTTYSAQFRAIEDYPEILE